MATSICKTKSDGGQDTHTRRTGKKNGRCVGTAGSGSKRNSGSSRAMKKVLVTGISGFVGQHLARHLVDNGFLVRGMGRLPKRQTTLSDVVDYIQVSDAQAVDDWDRYLKDCEVIVHLAAKVHEIEKTDNKDEYDLVNAVVTEKFAQAAAGHGVKKFVFLSTIKVNGEETFEKPFTEEDDPKPEGAYAKSKFKAEQALLRIQAETKMGVVIIRTPLVYGPGVKGNFLRLLWLSPKGVPLPLGRFQNVRHMISVGNLCDLI